MGGTVMEKGALLSGVPSCRPLFSTCRARGISCRVGTAQHAQGLHFLSRCVQLLLRC